MLEWGSARVGQCNDILLINVEWEVAQVNLFPSSAKIGQEEAIL